MNICIKTFVHVPSIDSSKCYEKRLNKHKLKINVHSVKIILKRGQQNEVI